MRIDKAVCMAAMLSMTACEEKNESIRKDEAIKISQDFLHENLPQISISKLQVYVEETENQWIISYDYPGGSTGGPFVFDIGKRDGKINDVEISQ